MKDKILSVVGAALTLTVIAGGITALLAGTNLLTRDTIAARSEQAATEARQQVLAADSFEEATITIDGEEVVYHKGMKDGNTVGYVFSVSSSGKSAGLVVMTGVDTDGTVTGVAVTENNETAGYVEKVEKAGLLAAMVGQSSTDGVDTVSQATKTSHGILDGVDRALTIYEAVKGGAVDE